MMIASASQQDMALEAKSSKEKCGICCIPIAARGVLDCCSDIFCFSCIDTWSAFTNLCPLCKLQFKFITFVPVADDEDASDVETQEAFFDFLGQERADNWIDDNEEDGTLSFPSYFIDEDAVVCLDGDGCHVRRGLNEEDGESGLEDTSVACDSCDCWYHASCVGYKPDSHGERSWICPRCVGTGVLDLFKFQLPSKNLTSKLSSKNMSLDKDGSFTFVDEGETAVVVSMDASFRSSVDQAVDQASSVKSTGLGIESSVDEPCLETYMDAEKISVGVTDFLSKDASIVVPSVSPPQPEASAFDEVDGQKGAAVENLSTFTNSEQEPSDTCFERPAAGVECSMLDVPSQDLVVQIKESSFSPSIEDKESISSSTVAGAQPTKVSEEGVSNRNVADVGKALESMDAECEIKVDMAQEPKNLKQEIGSAKQHDKLLKRREPPHSRPDKQQREKKKLKSDDRGSLSSNNSVLNEAAQTREPVKQFIKEELIEDVKDQSDFCMFHKPDAHCLQEVKSEVINELKELVQGPAPCHRRVVLPRVKTNRTTNGTSEGVRTRKIVYRGSVLDENVSRIVNEMRQHLKREAAAVGVTGDGRQVDVTDEKFFVAFKAAIQSSQANPTQPHLAPVKKLSLQKPGFKRDGSRQSLMKKLYGGSGKRRQAWDRDWDVSFWRERATREKKSRQSNKTLLQQEMAHIVETLQDSKKATKAELDSLKSRVYLADTSLLPRQKDIKPLSEHSTVKTNSVNIQQSKPLGHAKVPEGASKHATPPEISNAVASDKNQPLKTDKRKWALEVLARKTGQSEKLQRDTGSLLEEMPGHMRPVLEYERRSKVPTATRQIQLDRFIELYLQQAPIESVSDNPECQEAIAAAMNKEKEIYDRSNSKGVYVNLCVQALASLPKLATSTSEEKAAEYSSSEVELPSVEAAGTSHNEDLAVLMAWKAAGLISDSPPESPVCVGQDISTPEMGIDRVDLDGQDGFSRSVNDVGNSSFAGNSHSAEILLNSSVTETGGDKLCANGMETCLEDTSRCNGTNDMEKVQVDGEPDVQREMGEEEEQCKAAGCEQPSLKDAPDQEGKQETQHQCSIIDMSVQKQPAAIIQESATNVREAAWHTNESADIVSKQVESYVKDHIRPLHRSHIITTEQYKWAVAKTTNKVLQHHSQAKSADFLIAEGEKVRRLAEQYLQLYSEHIYHGVG